MDHRRIAPEEPGSGHRVHRHVHRCVHRTAGGHVIELSRTFAEPPARLWRAVTDPDHLGRWFGCLQGRLQRGGSYRLPDMGVGGRILHDRLPRRLELTWEVGHDLSELSLRVDPDAGDPMPGASGSRLTLRHTVPEGDHWELFGPAAIGIGWDVALLNLTRHLQDPGADHLAEAVAGARTAEDRAFVRASASAWERAHVAAGADPVVAGAAAERTTAYHLGRS